MGWNLLSLRRHDPDQVLRVAAPRLELSVLSASQPLAGAPPGHTLNVGLNRAGVKESRGRCLGPVSPLTRSEGGGMAKTLVVGDIR
uniref:Uncharacterized protein n=1 Tax=uncultured marine microorganism HF4000_APKG2J17 TaxID=455546 RepID=B3T6K7_9ZZZZ|nr:hypothetical protein ALOHA_HF4000APKG2J17ctg1g23 [uncultured marine microorganism HF4000_APKG2J17]